MLRLRDEAGRIRHEAAGPRQHLAGEGLGAGAGAILNGCPGLMDGRIAASKEGAVTEVDDDGVVWFSGPLPRRLAGLRKGVVDAHGAEQGVVERVLADILPAGLAGVGAGHVAKVVDELEGEARGLEPAAQGVAGRVVRTGGAGDEGTAQAEEGAGLAEGHLPPQSEPGPRLGEHGAGLHLDNGGAGHTLDDIDGVDDHGGPLWQGRDQVERSSEDEVATQDGERIAIGGVDGRQAAAPLGAINDVVVKKGGAVDQLDDGSQLGGHTILDAKFNREGATDTRPRPPCPRREDETCRSALEPCFSADNLGQAALHAVDERLAAGS